jgi:hypothetical protein
MRKAPIRAAGALAAAMAVSAAAQPATGDRQQWTVQLDAGAAAADTPLPARTAGSLGKLRFAESGGDIEHGFGAYRARLTPTLNARLTADYTDGLGGGLDLTEAYLEWRPIPASANRQQWRFGAFHAPFSLENTEAGWTTPFTISPSAINTWLGEELRTIGAEWQLQRRLGAPAAQRRLGVHAAVFFGNDPAGSLLAWQGWALHDLQSRLGDKLPLAALPQLQAGGAFAAQDPYVAPFREIDDRAGYYVGAEWRRGRRTLLRVSHYDNRGDPEATAGGQYAWATSFDQLGAQLDLPGDFGVILQWLRGRTAMGPLVGPAHAVDVRFRSHFVMATKRFGNQRLSLRYDAFSAADADIVPNDDNSESGHAWTAAYGYRHSQRLSAAWLDIASSRPARAYAGTAPHQHERLVRVQIRVGLGNFE